MALVVCAACGGGEGRPDEELEGLVVSTPPPEPIDVAKAASSPAELARALAMPHHVSAAALGAHVFRGASKLRVVEGADEVEAIDDTTAIDYAADGSFRAILDNSRDYGRHAIYAGGTLYLRPRFGKYHARAPTERDEPAAICDEVYATFGDYFDLASNRVAVADAGAATVAGRSGRAITLSKAASERPRKQTLAQRKWRETIAVESIDGEVVLDDETGAVLRGKLTASVQFVRDGRTFQMTVEATHAIESVGGAVAVEAPAEDEIVATPHRSHELEERDALLEGIAPPAAKRRQR